MLRFIKHSRNLLKLLIVLEWGVLLALGIVFFVLVGAGLDYALLLFFMAVIAGGAALGMTLLTAYARFQGADQIEAGI